MQVKLTGLELLVYRHTRMNELLMCSKNSGAEGVGEYGPAGGPFVVAFDEIGDVLFKGAAARMGRERDAHSKQWEVLGMI